MTPVRTSTPAALLAAVLAVAGCEQGAGTAARSPLVRQTGLPGHVTAGGPTGGDVIARAASAAAKDMTAASREAGTPGIPQGAGGNTGGTRLGGTTGPSALANTGEQTATQRTPGQPAPAHAADAGRGAAPAPPRGASAPAAAAAPTAPPAPASATPSAAQVAADQARALDERMTLVAQRWQRMAAVQGWRAGAAGAPAPQPAPAASAGRR